MFHLTITVDGVNRFVTHPDHETSDLKGYIRCDALGGELPVEAGTFNLFVDDVDPARKKLLYRLFCRDSAGQPRTLSGFKDIRDDPGRDLTEGPTLADRTSAMARFGRLFMGTLRDVYARKVPTSGPC